MIYISILTILARFNLMSFNEVILGCSPFTLVNHFGHRTHLYELDFQNKPENILQIINKSNELNVKSMMLKNNADLVKALSMSVDEGYDWSIYGYTNTDNFYNDMELFSNFNTKSVIIDGLYVDDKIKNDGIDDLKTYLDEIKSHGYDVGIETRQPFKNIPLISNSSIVDFFDDLLIPFNFYGYMMDCNFFNKENRQVFEEIISTMDKNVIANRTLATGILKVKEAYDFIKNVDYIDSVCVGVAKISEADETFSYINNCL